jgi:hypothetical protein
VVGPTVVCKTSCRCGADRHRLRLKPNEDRRGPCLLLFDKGYLIRLEDRGSLFAAPKTAIASGLLP